MAKTLLIAEDELKDLFENIFKLACDYDIKTAENGLEAVRMTRMYQPALIIMDMRMPRLGGLEAIKRIRKFNPSVPIVAVSAYADEYKVKALQAGANLFIAKPFDVEDLLHQVAQLLGSVNAQSLGT